MIIEKCSGRLTLMFGKLLKKKMFTKTKKLRTFEFFTSWAKHSACLNLTYSGRAEFNADYSVAHLVNLRRVKR